MFIVIELQTINEETVANIVNVYTDSATAEQKYHTILSSASVSTLPCHAAVMTDEKGNLLKHEYYTHEVIPNE